MRALLALGLLALLLPAAASAQDGACGRHLHFEGNWYEPFGSGMAAQHDAPVGEIPECTHPPTMAGGAPVPARTEPATQLMSLAGVPPRVALGRADTTGMYYLAYGLLTRWRSHPLHGLLADDERWPRRCTKRKDRRLRGRIGGLNSWGTFGLDGRAILLHVTPRTRFRGPRVEGIPYLREDDRVTAYGCRFNDAGDPGYALRRLRVAE